MSDQNIPVTADASVQIDCDNNNNNSSDQIIKFSHDNGTELMRIQEDGNVGVGSTSPNEKLQVNGNISIGPNSGSGTYLVLRKLASVHQSGDVPNSTRFGMMDAPGGTFAGMSVNGARDGNYNSYSLSFATHHAMVSAGTRMTIDKDGKVGIGTASPGAVLEITKSVTSSGDPDPANTAFGVTFNQTLIAHDNGVYLSAAAINPTFNDNSKANLVKECLQIFPQGSYSNLKGINIYIPGGTNQTSGIFIDVGGSANGIQCAVQGSGTAITGRAEGTDANSCGGTFTARESNQYALKTLTGLVTLGGSVGIGAAPPTQKLDVNGNIKASGQFILPSFTKTTLPTGVTGGMIYVTNDVGGAVPAFYDGSNWRRVTDRNIIS